MKKLFVMMSVLLLVPFVVAQSYSCYSESQLQEKDEECRSVGLVSSRYVDANGCGQVRCQDVEHTCLSRDDLARDAEICQDKGIRAVYDIDRYDCQFVTCLSARCTTDQVHTNAVEKCKELGRFPDVTVDDEGCRIVTCMDLSCPDVSSQKESCVRRELDAVEYKDAKGCDAVKCATPPGVACRRSTTGDCYTFSCSDGMMYDSCKSCPATTASTSTDTTTIGTTDTRGFWARLFNWK